MSSLMFQWKSKDFSFHSCQSDMCSDVSYPLSCIWYLLDGSSPIKLPCLNLTQIPADVADMEWDLWNMIICSVSSFQGNFRERESQNCWVCKKPLRSSSPACPRPPINHIPMSVNYLQGRWLNHFSGWPVPMLYNAPREEMFPNIKPKVPWTQFEVIVLSLVTSQKRPNPTSLQPPFREL